MIVILHQEAGTMEEKTQPEENRQWREEHPWLAEESDIDEVVRYSLDEIRIA